MFRKRSAKKPHAIRRRADSDDEDDKSGPRNTTDAEAETSTTQQIIQETRKKRKLLTAVQYKRGVDATQLMQKETAAVNLAGDGSSNNPKATASGSPAVKTAAETSRDGALERKHREAMEAFIEERMGKDKPEETPVKQLPSRLTEEALYTDLAAQSARLAGKPMQDEVDEERGAVLVAGTGIAEVILPVTERLKVAKETETANSNRSTAKPVAPGTALPAAVPNRFAVASTMSHSEFNSQYSRVHNLQQSANQTKKGSMAGDESTADAARPGFDATRQSSRPTTQGAASKRDQASDHKVFTKFVTRQRELRK